MAIVTMRSNMGIWMSDSAPADPAAPTVAEIAAATSLLGVQGGEALVEFSGWDSTVSDIDAPDVITMQTPTIPGEEKLGIGTLTYKIDTIANAIADALPKGTSKWIYFAPVSRAGAAGDEISVFQATVQKNQPNWQPGNTPAVRMITLSKGQQYDNSVIAA